MKLFFVFNTSQQLSPTQPGAMRKRTGRGAVRKPVGCYQDSSPSRVLLRLVPLDSWRKEFYSGGIYWWKTIQGQGSASCQNQDQVCFYSPWGSTAGWYRHLMARTALGWGFRGFSLLSTDGFYPVMSHARVTSEQLSGKFEILSSVLSSC